MKKTTSPYLQAARQLFLRRDSIDLFYREPGNLTYYHLSVFCKKQIIAVKQKLELKCYLAPEKYNGLFYD